MSSRLLIVLGVAGALLLASFPGKAAPLDGTPPSSPPSTAWAYSSPHWPPAPQVHDRAWPVNPIDAFILARLEAEQLTPSPRADRLTLLRRVTFDLTGLPPTLAEQEAFLADTSTNAYEKVVDRLLASPRYGERWAQHWLDLVRYAETDGFKADDYRPNAYRYRDYVIAAFNEDLPFDRFLRQQLAGDELEPDNPQALIATGFNRLWPDEYNAANLEQRRQEILDDVTDVTGQVFLGLTVGCARCHDHKFDPILQSDYYRLQAFFAPMQPHDDLPAATPREVEEYRRQLTAWENATADLRKEMAAMVATKRAEARKTALGKFRQEIQQAALMPDEQRTLYQKQIVSLAEKQMQRAEQDAPNKLPKDQKKHYQELEQQLAARQPARPKPLPVAMSVRDMGPHAPPTYVLAGGNWDKPGEEVQPGFPEFLDAAFSPRPRYSGGEGSGVRGDDVPRFSPLTPTPSPPSTGARGKTTGRRTALARWLARPDHPLTARVRVNRLWQHHFGRGIVGTPSDFGSQGEPATHPELLDWLAVEFVEHGWSEKYLHKLMVMSATYCQSSQVDPRRSARAQATDRENRLLWHAQRRRLEGEAIRDAMLLLSGDLDLRMYGPSARPELPERISTYAWKPDPKPEDRRRRSIYVFAKRNMRYPLFDAFDLPDMHNSCARRTQTTTAPQALLLLNGELTWEQARRWSEELRRRCAGDDKKLVALAYRSAWGRRATEEEMRQGLAYLQRPGVSPADFCHALLNTNEFLYVD